MFLPAPTSHIPINQAWVFVNVINTSIQSFGTEWCRSAESNEDRSRLFSVVPGDGTWGNGNKVKYRGSVWAFFPMRWQSTVTRGCGLPPGWCEKAVWTLSLGKQLWVSLLGQVGPDDLQRSLSQPAAPCLLHSLSLVEHWLLCDSTN